MDSRPENKRTLEIVAAVMLQLPTASQQRVSFVVVQSVGAPEPASWCAALAAPPLGISADIAAAIATDIVAVIPAVAATRS